MKTRITLLTLVMVIAACGQQGQDIAAEYAEPAAVDSAVYANALANPLRPEADRARDAARKPDQVLEFFGIAPGMTVLDMFSGGGYYTEILSSVVGSEGQVTAHMNTPMLGFVEEEFTARHAENRLANVSILMAENNELELESGMYDAMLMSLNYHDIYWVGLEYGWEKIDGPKLLAELFDGLKPGGILGIIDHYAEAGSPRETGGTLHRIDPSIVIAELEAAGFELVAKSDLLRNIDDDHSRNVFDTSIRGKTDRFVLRFTKPK